MASRKRPSNTYIRNGVIVNLDDETPAPEPKRRYGIIESLNPTRHENPFKSKRPWSDNPNTESRIVSLSDLSKQPTALPPRAKKTSPYFDNISSEPRAEEEKKPIITSPYFDDLPNEPNPHYYWSPVSQPFRFTSFDAPEEIFLPKQPAPYVGNKGIRIDMEMLKKGDMRVNMQFGNAESERVTWGISDVCTLQYREPNSIRVLEANIKDYARWDSRRRCYWSNSSGPSGQGFCIRILSICS